MHSVMEIYFQLQGDSLVRGIGVMKTKNDSAYFEDPALLQYVGQGWRKIPCMALPLKARR